MGDTHQSKGPFHSTLKDSHPIGSRWVDGDDSMVEVVGYYADEVVCVNVDTSVSELIEHYNLRPILYSNNKELIEFHLESVYVGGDGLIIDGVTEIVGENNNSWEISISELCGSALERIRELEKECDELKKHADNVADSVGLPRNVHRYDTNIIIKNISNMRRFSSYLHEIELELMTVPLNVDEDDPCEEDSSICLVNSWGAKSKDDYVEEWVSAFKQFKVEWQIEALQRVSFLLPIRNAATKDLIRQEIIRLGQQN